MAFAMWLRVHSVGRKSIAPYATPSMRSRVVADVLSFARVHRTLRVTPAMEACESDHVWNIDEIVVLLK
jgi:hypothetical protein